MADGVGARHPGHAAGAPPEADGEHGRGLIPTPPTAGAVGGGRLSDRAERRPRGRAGRPAEARHADVDAERDGEPPRAAVEAGYGVEVDREAGPEAVAEERGGPRGVLGLEAPDGLERPVGPDGGDGEGAVGREADREAGPLVDRPLIVEREGLDGVLVRLHPDELGRDGEVAEPVAERERDGRERLPGDVAGRERGAV